MSHVPSAIPILHRQATLALAVACSLLALLVASIAPAAAQSDPSAQRRKAQQQRAQKAAEVNALKASDAELERAIDALNGNLRSQEAAAATARQAAATARSDAATARAEQERTLAQLAEVQGAMRQVAVEAYIRGPDAQGADVAGATLSDTVLRQHLLDLAVGRSTDLADQLEALGEDLAAKRAAADDAAERSSQRKRQMDAQLGQLAAARSAKQKLADNVETRLERALGEADSLAAVDKQLAASITARQAALARKAGPTSSRGTTATARAPSRSPSSGASGSRPTSNPNLRTVRGITVAASIADNLEALLNASDGAGMNFGGQGYRSSEGQVQTRRNNCGTSDYDVYEKPASQCSPPTARPGQSMHEQGLAVDFTNNGRLIQSRSDPAFVWLKGNASRFGFHNLPAEPWHWSTNGN
jgi:peptidoglycan hydrolase CwlO-like protein